MFKPSGRLEAQKERLEQTPHPQLRRLFGVWLGAETALALPKRRRLFSPSGTFWLFLSQVLSSDGSCREALRAFQAWLAGQGKTASVRTAAYCKARARLPLKSIQQLNRRLAHKIAGKETKAGLWRGRKVKVVDGSCVSMPDTPQNQRVWPQPATMKPGCGFPVMRLAAVFSLASGALLALGNGGIHCHERTLFRRLWRYLKAGDVVLADRGFCSYADFVLLAGRGVDCVMRKHQRRLSGVLKKLGRKDYLTQWAKSGVRPAWLTEKQWASVPDKITVREITITVGVRGFRTKNIAIATTLADPVAFPAEAFAELYLKRWKVELYFRDIKITMGMDVLRCKTPQMVEKELWMRVIAYNLIRAIMQETACAHGLQTERLSFKGALSTLRQWSPVLAEAGSDKAQEAVLYKVMLAYIACDVLATRPNRVEPRARKRRPKNYQLLNKPRGLFHEIPHRNKYRRTLS